MRKLLLINLLLGVLLGLPALALGDDEREQLRQRLSRTVASLAQLAGIQERLAARDPAAVAEILAASAPGPTDAAQAEFDLMALRTSVGSLLEQLDARGLAQVVAEHAPAFGARVDGALAQSNAAEPSLPTPRAAPGETAAELLADPKVQFEADGFVADHARLGRACWRGGRYQEGVSALEPLAGNVQADYWRARCLERLGRSAEALKLYQQVIEAAGDSPEGRSAREDSEFLQWTLLHGLVSER